MAGLVLFLKGLWGGAVSVGRSLSVLGWTAVALVITVVLLLATCAHHSAQQADQSRRAAEERAQALDKGRKADGKADIERMSDVKIIYNREKELTDAVEALPDSVPSPRRIALACERLRQQRTPAADLPARCRSGG